MNAYESPTLTKVGTVAELTQGDSFQPGQDNLTWVLHTRLGSGPGDGGGFGS